MRETHHRIDDFPNEVVADWFAAAFANYVGGEVGMDGDRLAAFLHVNHVDADVSRIIHLDDAFAALALVARAGTRSRVTAMGVAAGFRRAGVADRLLTDLIADARQRGDDAMVLEVIEQNEPAVALYRKHGFTVVRRLCGWSIHRPAGSSAKPVARTTREEVSQAAAGASAQDLPWQIALPNLTRLSEDAILCRRGDTYVAATPGLDDEMVVEALFSRGDALDLAHAVDCLNGLFAAQPNRDWRVPVRFPEDYGTVFESLGARREKLTQLQMSLEL